MLSKTDPKSLYPISKVEYAKDGRAFVRRNGRRRYGIVKSCVECGDKFLSVNPKVNQGYCSRSCGKKGKPNIKNENKKGLKLRCDRLFSLAVRSKGSCERCGRTDRLQCAHVISRRYLSIRWNWYNALCLCVGCHYWGHANPLEWEKFVISKIGETEYEYLKKEGLKIAKVDYHILLERMTKLCEMNGVDTESSPYTRSLIE